MDEQVDTRTPMTLERFLYEHSPQAEHYLREYQAKHYAPTPTPPAGQVEAVAECDIFEPWIIEQWCGEGGIDGLDTQKNYTVTGLHLKEILTSYRALHKASGAEHIAGLAKASIDIASFAQHDEDCHINNWGDNQIPECTCGYTSAQGALCDILEALPPELRGK